MAGNPNHVAVPTLDVDLAWHTHQLSPARYYSYSVAKTSVFIDHDDKIEETKLSDAFKLTSRMYQKLTGGEIYSECTCWYCEAIRESHTSTAGRLFSSSDRNAQTALDQLHDNSGVSDDPNKNAHISAHNAVKTDSAVASTAAAVKAAQLEASYQKACGRAKKRNRDPPRRDADVFGYYAWGYPLYYPGLFYAPYMAPMAITGEMYPCNPSWQRATVAKERVVLAWQQAAVAVALLARVLEALQASSLNDALEIVANNFQEAAVEAAAEAVHAEAVVEDAAVEAAVAAAEAEETKQESFRMDSQKYAEKTPGQLNLESMPTASSILETLSLMEVASYARYGVAGLRESWEVLRVIMAVWDEALKRMQWV
ncbi:hypothetical protein V1515DRAFT_581326 [Lipomyces mesembrius]